MSVKYLLKYAELHDICLDKGTHIRLRKAYLRIFGKVPKSCCRTALVNTPVGVCGSVVIATNKNSKELERVDDLEMIHKVQLAMGIMNLRSGMSLKMNGAFAITPYATSPFVSHCPPRLFATRLYSDRSRLCELPFM